jgi:predicted DNA-binding transcriptional regulator YafY
MQSLPSPQKLVPASSRKFPAHSASGNAQLARLLQLIVALQSNRYPNARVLAELCEVSRRTIYRDLETLEDAGFSVRYRADRQGYQLVKSTFLPPPCLGQQEVLALLALSRQWKGGDGLGLLRHARAGAVKLVQALAPDVRSQMEQRAELIPEPMPMAPLPRDRQVVYDTILEALAQRLQLRIWYRERTRPSLETTKLGIYRLLLANNVWALIGRSTLHRQVRVFRIPQIARVVRTDDPYIVPPRFDLERFLAQAWMLERGPDRHEVWLRFSAALAAEIRETAWHRSQRIVCLDDGRVDLHLQIDGLDEIQPWVLGFGDQVEILAPIALRDRVHAQVLGMVWHHGQGDRERGGPELRIGG